MNWSPERKQYYKVLCLTITMFLLAYIVNVKDRGVIAVGAVVLLVLKDGNSIDRIRAIQETLEEKRNNLYDELECR